MRKLLYITLAVLIAFACEEPGDADILNAHSVVPVEGTVELNVPTTSALWIDINAESATLDVTGEGLDQIDAISVDVRLVGTDGISGEAAVLEEITDVASLSDTISLTYTGTEILSALGLSADAVAAGSKFVLSFTKTIDGVKYSDRGSYTILVSCPTNIALGDYQLKGGTDIVTLTYDGAGIYTLSNLNFNYYSPSYGDINAKFLDVCNDLTLQGFSGNTPYGIAWVGEGSYNPDTGEISFNYADATYNPSYFAAATFVPVP